MLKRGAFRIVVAIVAVLILCLLVVQLYWVQHAYDLKEKLFAEKVQQALKATAEKMDNSTFSYYMYARTYIPEAQGIVILQTDTSGTYTDTVNIFNTFSYTTKPETCFYKTSAEFFSNPMLVDITLRYEYMSNEVASNLTGKNNELDRLTLTNYRNILDDTRPISKRTDLELLDSVLSANLLAASVNIPYTYGLRKKGASVFEYVSDSNALSNLFKTSYITTLFSGKPFITPYEFAISFPDKSNFITMSLLWGLLISFIIIVLLVAAFLFFFNTVLKQKKLSAMKTDFINNMTHEFMTPVTNISLALETLEKRRKSEENDSRILEVIETENEHLRENINKVLQVALLDNKNFILEPSSVDIHKVLRRIARNFELNIQAKGGKFSFDLNAERHTIIGDETHIINLFYNIVDNAVKYASEQPLLINISSGNQNEKLWVKIEDNGIGISNHTLKNIFDKFYRGVNGDVHTVKGFGLGLAYVKSIADAHHIYIDVKSAIGKGTTFTLWLNL